MVGEPRPPSERFHGACSLERMAIAFPVGADDAGGGG